MKRKLKLSLLFFFMLVGFVALAKTPQTRKAKTVAPKIIIKTPKAVMADTASISGTTSVCQNAAKPKISLKAKDGNFPYTFVYKINNGADVTCKVVLSKDTTLEVSTDVVTTYTYTLISVKDKTGTDVKLNSINTATVTVNTSPIADFSFNNDNSCSGTEITFTPTVTPTGSYIYNWDFGDGKSSTDVTAKHIYNAYGTGSQPFTVNLKVTSSTGCTSTVTKNINVKRGPEALLDTTGVNGGTLYNTDEHIFVNCEATPSSPEFDFIAINNSNNTSNNTYTINWGDSSPLETFTSFSTAKTHRYTSLGFFDITLTVSNSNTACTTNKIYKFFNGNTPAGNLGGIGNTTDCVPYTLTWPIENAQNNTPGTKYIFSVNDGSPDQEFDQSNYPATISHTFTKSSCGMPNNEFEIKLKIRNPCDTKTPTLQVKTSQKPIASFTVSPSNKTCKNNILSFTNTSIGNYFTGLTCSSVFIKKWSISPNTGWTLINGSLDVGSEQIKISFDNSGSYEVKLIVKRNLSTESRCTIDSITQVITVNSLPTITGTLTACVGITSQLTGSESPATNSPWISSKTSVATVSSTGLVTAIAAGTTTITYTNINGCQATAIFTVLAAPIVTGTLSACAGTSSQLSGNGTPDPTNAWNSSNTAVATVSNTGLVTAILAGSTTITYKNNAGCETSKGFTVNAIPAAMTLSDKEYCNGVTVPITTFTNAVAGTTYQWSNSNTAIGLAAMGSGNLPSFVAKNANSTPITAIITVIPSANGCLGTSQTFKITINPAPDVTFSITNQVKCSGQSTDLVTLNSTTSGVNFSWTATQPTGITGTFTSSGTNAIPVQVLENITDTPIDILYKASATLSGGASCAGAEYIYSIRINPKAVILSAVKDSICNNSTFSLNPPATGGNIIPSGTLYSWNNPIVTGGITGGVAGNNQTTINGKLINPTNTNQTAIYTVTPSNNGCLGNSFNLEVTVLADPTVTISPATQTICRGTTPNDLKVVAAGGEGTFSYQWYSNVSNSIIGGNKITGATADVYTPPTTLEGTKYYFCEIKQTGLGCSVTSTPSKVEVVIAPTVSPQPISNSLCQNGSTPKLTVGYINGTGIASYQWYSNATNTNTSGHAITGATNSDYQPITTAIDTTYYYCEINLSGGGCSRLTSLPAAIAVNAVPKISTQPVDSQAICVDGTIPSLQVATLGGAGNVSYQWYRNSSKSNSGGQAIAGAFFNNYAPPAFNVAGKYYYYVEINFSEGSCGQLTSNVAQVVVLPDPVVDFQPIIGQTICQNTIAQQLEVRASGGVGKFSYQWFVSNTNTNLGGATVASATDSIFTPPSTVVGTKYYYCEISQINGSGCKVTSQPSALTVNQSAIINMQPQSQVICKDDVPADLTVSYQFGAGIPTYQWYKNSTNALGGQAIVGATISNYKPQTSVAKTDYYYCIITLPSGGCSPLTSDIVSVTVNPYAVIADTALLICSGNSFRVSPKDNGVDFVPSETTYTWPEPVVVPAGAVEITEPTWVTPPEIFGLIVNLTTNPATVTYTVTPMSGSCPGKPFKITVTVNPSVNAVITKINSSCFNANNGELHASISGGIPFSTGEPYRVSWSGPNGFRSTQADNVGLTPGVYNLNIQDAGGCPYSRTDTIYEPADLIIYTDTFKNASCNNAANGKIAVSITGGTAPYRFAWEKDYSPFSNKQNLSNLSPGEYQLTVTDNNGCIPKTAQFTITEPTPLTVKRISKKDNICFGDSLGSITVSASGGTPFGNSPSNPYVFQWTGPNGFVSNSQNLNRLPVGIYNLTVTDLNGCAVQLSETITQPTEIKIEAVTTPITCYGANNASLNVTLSGGNPPYTTEWSNLANGLFQDNLSAGDYIITVVDASQCQKVAHIIIPEAPIFTIRPVVKNVSCYGAKDGNITLNLTGGTKPIKLLWDDNAVVGNIRNNLGPGTYVVHISDGVPCSITDTFTITEPDELLVSAKITNAFDCNDARSGAIKLTVSGGVPPYKYNWTNGAKTDSLSRITAGTYTVTITDSVGCTRSAQYKVARHQPLDIRINSVISFNCTTKVIKAVSTAYITGGVQPYKLTWSTGKISGENNEIMETEQNGIVILDVTDALGCAASTTFNTNIPQVGIDYKLLDCNNNIVQFRALVPNESSNSYSYLWDFGDGQTADTKAPTHTFAKAGSYKVTLTFTANSCQAVYETTVVVGQLPIITISPLPKLCKSDSVIVFASGADTYKWSDGSTADSLVIKHDGEYSVTGTLKSGCSSTYQFVASYYDTSNYSIMSDKDEVGIESQSEPLHLWSDDIPSSVYYWDFGDGTTDYGRDLYHKFNVLKDGYFDVKLQVTNPYGCTETFTKRIWQNASTTTNTFSPNGDGKNDVFLQGWHIQVFNRNGVMIYDGVDGWDGTHNGKQVSNDTYFYVQYYSAGSGSKSTTGFVTVIR